MLGFVDASNALGKQSHYVRTIGLAVGHTAKVNEYIIVSAGWETVAGRFRIQARVIHDI